MSHTPSEIIEAEIEILKKVPHDQLWEFIEKNGARLRSILEQDEDDRTQEEIENLTRDYVWI